MRRSLPPLLAAVAVTATVALAASSAGLGTGRPAQSVTAPSVALPGIAASGEQIRVASWNICGEAGGDFGSTAYCPHRDEPDRKVDAIAALIAEHQLNVVMLQEACNGPLVEDQPHGNVSMLDRLQTRLGSGWSTAWAEMQRPGGRSDCRGELGGTLGVAIAVRGRILTTLRRPLPVPHGSRLTDPYSQPAVLCVQAATPVTVDGAVQNRPWRTEVCTTHLVNDNLSDSAYAAEVATLTDFVSARPPNQPHVVIGGDFNTQRWNTWLKTMHDRYRECDEKAYSPGDAVREPTIGPVTGTEKIDYIFSSAGFTACDVQHSGYQDTSTTSVPNGASDHAPIVGYTVTLP